MVNAFGNLDSFTATTLSSSLLHFSRLVTRLKHHFNQINCYYIIGCRRSNCSSYNKICRQYFENIRNCHFNRPVLSSILLPLWWFESNAGIHVGNDSDHRCHSSLRQGIFYPKWRGEEIQWVSHTCESLKRTSHIQSERKWKTSVKFLFKLRKTILNNIWMNDLWLCTFFNYWTVSGRPFPFHSFVSGLKGGHA